MRTIFNIRLLLLLSMMALAGSVSALAQPVDRFCDSLKILQVRTSACCLTFNVLNTYNHANVNHNICHLTATVVAPTGATIVSGAGPANAPFGLISQTDGAWNISSLRSPVDSNYQLCVRNVVPNLPTQVVFRWYGCVNGGAPTLLCSETVNIDCFGAAAAKTDTVFTCGKVAVTCEAAGDNDPVMAIMSLAGIGAAPPVGSNWSTPAVSGDHGVGTMGYTLKNLGQIFGIAYDNTGIYVTSSAIYDPAPNYPVHANAKKWGTINSPHQTVGPENSGSIYFISNHVITELADLPNKGEGLGNICYDKLHNKLYVTNFHDGLIYIVNPATGASTTFDPKFDNQSYGTTGTFAPLGQRPWGIAVWGSTASNSVLYYSRWVYDQGTALTVLAINAGARNEIWSVGLDAAGAPIPATEALITRMPVIPNYTYSSPIADLEISTDGLRMLASERTMYNVQSAAHQSRLIEFRRNTPISPWVSEPPAKFAIGSLGSQINATGGCDYGDITLDEKGACNGTVYAMSDYINATGFGLAYGFQIMSPTGGSPATSKIVDLNNAAGTQDKTTIGDIDYKRCLNCPPPIDSCSLFQPDTLGGTCCKGGLLSISPAGEKGIVKVSYSVANGVVQGFTSNCTFTSIPANVAGTTSGTLNFPGTCSLQQLYGSLQTTSLSGEVTIFWTLTFATGRTCVYVSRVTGCPPPPRICSDKIDVKQCNCGPTASQGYLDLMLTNAASPASTLCGVLITKLDPLSVPQTGYWASASFQNPAWTSVNVAGSGVLFAPMAVPVNGIFHAQMYFFGTSFTGSIMIRLIHCSGNGSDTCTYVWRPANPWVTPTDKATIPSLTLAKSSYDKLFSLPFRLIGPATPQINICAIKYWSITTLDDAAVSPTVVAVTGAEQYQDERARKTGLAAPLEKSSMASRTVLFELQREIGLKRGDSTEAFTIVFGGIRPTRLRYSLYDATGSLISTDTVLVDSSRTTDVRPTTRLQRNEDFLLMTGYPNPASDRLNIRYMTGSPQEIIFSISDLDGGVVREIDEGNIFAGIHDSQVDISKLPNGSYIIRMKSSSGLISDPMKIVIVR